MAVLTAEQNHTPSKVFDYYANKQNTFGVIVNGNFTNNDITNYGTTPVHYIGNGKMILSEL